MPSSAFLPPAAYCEEYNEDAHTTIPETRQSANVAAKRSRPDVAKPRLPETIRDEFSDSGYSSRTAATLGSGDSSLASKTDAAPLDPGDNDAVDVKRRTGFQEDPQATSQNARKPTLRRTESKARGGTRQQKETDSQEKAATVQQSTKSPGKGGSSTRATVSYATQPTSPKPLSSTPAQNMPIPQPAQLRPRAMTSQSYRAGRPMSFHAGVTPQISYTPPLYIPAVGYPNPAPPPPSQPSQTAAYFAPQQSPVQAQAYSFPSSPYDLHPRPPSRQWISEQSRPYRQSAVYHIPQGITYAHRPTFPSRTEQVTGNVCAQTAHQQQPRERRYSRDEDYYKMPPPAIPKKTPIESHQNQRPSIRHAATSSATMQRRSGRTKEYRDDSRGPPNPKTEKPSTRENSRRPPVTKRPSATPSNNSAPSTHAIERDMARLSFSDHAAKQRRRMSYHGHESHRDLERSVEAYQAETGIETLPVTADSLDLVRKKTVSSNTSSRVSGRSGRGSREGSDVKPRSSTDRRGGSDVKTRNDDDGLTMRFNASHGVNLDLKGGSVEGRTISLRQSKDGGDGDMEFSIGGKSNETGSKTEVKEKRRKRYSIFGGSGLREVEPASRSASRPSRDAKADEEKKSSSKKISSSRSRRSSRSGRG